MNSLLNITFLNWYKSFNNTGEEIGHMLQALDREDREREQGKDRNVCAQEERH